MKRYVRGILAAAAILVIAVAGAVWWLDWGPGLEREAGRLVAIAGIRPGMTVADAGAGSGRMAVQIAARVGPSGRVIATEIDRELLRRIGERAAAKGLGNVSPVLAGESTTGLAANCCDVIYLRRVYHHLSDPQAIGAGLAAALRPGGRLAVIDFMTPDWLPFVRHGVPARTVRGGLERAGFVLEQHVQRWSPFEYCLVFRKSG